MNEIGFSLNVRKIFGVMANERDLQSSINRPDRDRVLFVGKNTDVISNCSQWLKNSLRFLVPFISIHDLGNTPNNHLSGKIQRILNLSVNKMVKSELIEFSFLPCNPRNLIAGKIGSLQGSQKREYLFFGREKFDLKSQLHSLSITQMFEIVKNLFGRRARAFLPTASRWGILPEIL
jgi:hypothetical protein